MPRGAVATRGIFAGVGIIRVRDPSSVNLLGMTTSRLHHPTLALLAGGAGTRMGKPKAWLEFNGKPILEHLLDRWRWPGETILITSPSRENPPGSLRFNREIIDAVPDQGPLRGMLTALH